jgi:hypothetical protein
MRDKEAANRRERAIGQGAPASGLAAQRSREYRFFMSDQHLSGPQRGQSAERSERLSKALRANLRRRKAQARGRSVAERSTASAEKPGESKPSRD